MKTQFALWLLPLLLLSGCATVDSRIRKHQSAFDSWPADVQAMVRAEKVDIGFTPDQVRVAMGDPDRIFSRKSGEGEAEVWAYYERGPRFSLGLGVGSGGYRSSVGGGVVYDQQHDRMDDAARVVFEGGVVTAVEARKTK